MEQKDQNFPQPVIESLDKQPDNNSDQSHESVKPEIHSYQDETNSSISQVSGESQVHQSVSYPADEGLIDQTQTLNTTSETEGVYPSTNSESASISPQQIPATAQTSKSANYSRMFFLIICGVIGALLFLIFLGIFSPQYFLTIVNLLWLLLLIFIIVFVFMGVLVVVGLKDDVTKILDILVEGSLKFIDVANFLKKVASEFKRKVQDLLLFLTPLIAIAITAAIYFGLIYVYKYFGKTYDVTLLTVVLTAIVIALFGLINAPRSESDQSLRWFDGFKSKLASNFRDSSEIMIFIFFITMDSDRLIFLPDDLNVLLRAKIGDYDLMNRGISPDHLVTTLSIIGITIFIEVIRKFVKIFYLAIGFYKDRVNVLGPQIDEMSNANQQPIKKFSRADVLKDSIRKAFDGTKDDFARFMAYTTVLIIVFVFFPRLKLLAMLVTSITMLLLDVLMTERLNEMGNDEDLISRLMGKLFPGMKSKA